MHGKLDAVLGDVKRTVEELAGLDNDVLMSEHAHNYVILTAILEALSEKYSRKSGIMSTLYLGLPFGALGLGGSVMFDYVPGALISGAAAITLPFLGLALEGHYHKLWEKCYGVTEFINDTEGRAKNPAVKEAPSRRAHDVQWTSYLGFSIDELLDRMQEIVKSLKRSDTS